MGSMHLGTFFGCPRNLKGIREPLGKFEDLSETWRVWCIGPGYLNLSTHGIGQKCPRVLNRIRPVTKSLLITCYLKSFYRFFSIGCHWPCLGLQLAMFWAARPEAGASRRLA